MGVNHEFYDPAVGVFGRIGSQAACTAVKNPEVVQTLILASTVQP